MSTEVEQIEEILISKSAKLIESFNEFSTKLAFTFFYNVNVSKPELITYAVIIVTAVSLSIIGSYSTIEKPSNALKPSKEHPLFDPSDFDVKSDDETSMTGTSAATMPIVGGVVLMSLYYGIKNISKETLMYYMKNYIVVMSVVPNFNTVNFLIKVLSRKFSYWTSCKLIRHFKLTIAKDEQYNSFGVEENYLMDDSTKALKIMREEKLNTSRSIIPIKDQIVNFFCSTSEIISTPISILLSVLYCKVDGDANWLLSNTMAFSFTIFGIQSVRVTNVKTSVILLLGLFCYDVYFVFGTEVMETVALGLDIPLKIMIPRTGAQITEDVHKLPMAILGLGDVVMPSTFISLCLRFDLWKFHNTEKFIQFHHLQKYPKTYFITSLIGYTIGLVITMGVLEIYKTGQPALLYLVPSVLISVFATALVKGDLKQFLTYEEKTKEDLIDPSYKVSAETLRLLELDDEDDEEDEEDDEYVYEEDTVVVMDQYFDEESNHEDDDDDDDDDDFSELGEITSDEEETPSSVEYIPTAYMFDVPTDSDSEDEEFLPE